jgi:hypothetical protein
MSTVISTANLSALDARLRQMAFEAKGNLPLIGDKLVRTRKTERAYEVFNRWVGVGDAVVVDESAPYPSKEIKQWTAKTVNVKKFGFRIDVSRELIMDNLFTPIVDSVGRAIRNSMDQTREKRILNIINNGFDTTTTCDGGYLFASHTLVQGGTQRNNPATDVALDVDTLWAAINTMQTTVSNSSLYDSIFSPKYIVTSQTLQRRATEILNSEWIPYDVENQANTLPDLYKMTPLKSPLISSTTSWFLFADPAQLNAESLILLDREPLSIKALFDVKGDSELGSSIDYDVYSWRCRARYEADAIGWLGTYGTAGA